MKGLLIKDLLNLKQLLRQYITIFAVMTVFAVVMKNPSFCAIYVVICTSMLVLNSFGYDEQSKFFGYELTMPVSRRQVVQSKYALLIMLSGISFVTGTLFSIIINLFVKAVPLTELIVSVLAVCVLFFLCYAVLIPMIFKMGVEKSRMLMVVSFMVIFFVGIGMAKLAGMYNIGNTDLPTSAAVLIFAVVLAVCAAITYISYRCALRVINVKEY